MAGFDKMAALRRNQPTLRFIAVAALALHGFYGTAAAANKKDAEPEVTQEELEAWLDARGVGEGRDVGARAEDDASVPPVPPRKRGVTLQPGLGALAHTGAMSNVSPTAPWFSLQIGYEPFRWLWVFGATDMVFASTEFASPPPEARNYVLLGFGGGLAFLIPTKHIGVRFQGDVGVSTVTSDVLEIYGYTEADNVNLYYGGQLALEVYPVNPHYAIVANGGARVYSGMERDIGDTLPLAWTAGGALRYTF